MKSARIAVVSFPGNNCEVESIRAVRDADMEPVFFRWNDDRSKLEDIDGYFVPGGFSYEDRGRAGMVAARDPLLRFIAEEAEKGKVVIGNCNGAQILVESGLIPLDKNLRMSLARNVIDDEAVGFLSEWVWVAPACKPDRCATSDWKGTMHMPIAHGEGRFTTKDKDLLEELKKNDQIAFRYCDASGKVSEDPVVTPNGALYAIAGICNPAGNVVALMPHPERTPNGAAYFTSLRKWIEKKGKLGKGEIGKKIKAASSRLPDSPISQHKSAGVEIFIDTIIVNNEERTVEQAARRFAPELQLRQYRYVMTSLEPQKVLSDISFFNPNKERAFIRRGSSLTQWDQSSKTEKSLEKSLFHDASVLLRRDEPDTGAVFGKGSESGICYACSGISEQKLYTKELLEIFSNPHASFLQRLS